MTGIYNPVWKANRQFTFVKLEGNSAEHILYLRQQPTAPYIR